MKQSQILYLIADLSSGISPIEEALSAGVDIIQLREKNISSREYLNRARIIRNLADIYRTPFIVNDRLDIAFLSGADGVHLGNSDIPIKEARTIARQCTSVSNNFIIGATVKTVPQAIQAEQDGADYLGIGAWFPTSTKADAIPLSPDIYTEILAATAIPNVAIGGITPDNCSLPLSLGAPGLAVSAGILKAKHIDERVREFRRCLSGNYK